MEPALVKFMSTRTISLYSPLRTPLIKFRYGATRDTPQSDPRSKGPSGQTSAKPGEPIYDFQIPQRWMRKPISEEECAYINRGGPE